MIKKVGLSLLVFLFFFIPISALSIPKQDSSIYVNDYAEVLSEDTKQSLISINQSCDYQTGGYVVVATFDFIDDDLYDYAYQMFNKWGIGDSHNNNGVLLVLDIGNENCAWIIGTGLENILTDSRCQSIIDDYFKEDFFDKNYDKAVLNTSKQFIKYIENGNFQVDDTDSSMSLGMSLYEVIKMIGALFIIGFIVLVIILTPRHRSYGPRRYHRPPPPRSHGPYHMGGPGVPRPRSQPRMGEPPRRSGGPMGRTSGSSMGSRPSGGSMRSRPSGGTHHSGGRSRGSGGTLK